MCVDTAYTLRCIALAIILLFSNHRQYTESCVRIMYNHDMYDALKTVASIILSQCGMIQLRLFKNQWLYHKSIGKTTRKGMQPIQLAILKSANDGGLIVHCLVATTLIMRPGNTSAS